MCMYEHMNRIKILFFVIRFDTNPKGFEFWN